MEKPRTNLLSSISTHRVLFYLLSRFYALPNPVLEYNPNIYTQKIFLDDFSTMRIPQKYCSSTQINHVDFEQCYLQKD